MSAQVHSLLRASAGTGKTFRLSSRFLELMFSGVDPSQVLATTFTRKAAGEILDRVLERLVDAARDDSKLAELNSSMPAIEVSREDCELKLAQLTRRIDRFKIQTLDAFFMNLAKLYSLDLGMSPGWSIVEESADLVIREEALSRMITGADRGELVDLIRNLTGNAAGRSIRTALNDAVRNGRNAFLESRAEAWGRVDPGAGLDGSGVAAMVKALEAMPLPQTKAGKPIKYWQDAIPRVARHIESEDWSALFGETIIKNFVAGAVFSKHEIDAEIFQPILDHACQRSVAALALRTRAIRKFLDQFELHYGQLKSALGGYRFEDIPARIAPLGSNGFETVERERARNVVPTGRDDQASVA